MPKEKKISSSFIDLFIRLFDEMKLTLWKLKLADFITLHVDIEENKYLLEQLMSVKLMNFTVA